MNLFVSSSAALQLLSVTDGPLQCTDAREADAQSYSLELSNLLEQLRDTTAQLAAARAETKKAEEQYNQMADKFKTAEAEWQQWRAAAPSDETDRQTQQEQLIQTLRSETESLKKHNAVVHLASVVLFCYYSFIHCFVRCCDFVTLRSYVTVL